MKKAPSFSHLASLSTAMFIGVLGWVCLFWYPLLVIYKVFEIPRHVPPLGYAEVLVPFSLPGIILGLLLIRFASRWFEQMHRRMVLVGVLLIVYSLYLLVGLFIVRKTGSLYKPSALVSLSLLVLALAALDLAKRKRNETE
jgi:hypothetical protein